MDENTVLSFSPSAEVLKAREVVLRSGGMHVISVLSSVQAHFEITMGRCGVLLICYRLSEAEAQDLTTIFKRYCPQGRVVFVMEPSKGKTHAPAGSDFIVPESAGPEQILEVLNHNKRATAS
jgi:hypothetical protein